MKGVSAIIATILMLVITIGLAGTAYVYISGMMTGKTAYTISVIDYSCIACVPPQVCTRNMELVISNDGTSNIASAGITIFVDNQDQSGTFGAYAGGVWGAGNKDIASHTTKPILLNPGVATPAWLTTGTHSVLISTASNAQRVTIQCP